MWLLLYAENLNLISIVCPSSLRKGLVTVGGVDNFDHNPSSITAQSSFLGTAISITQFPTPDSVGDSRLDIPFITGDLDTSISFTSIILHSSQRYQCLKRVHLLLSVLKKCCEGRCLA